MNKTDLHIINHTHWDREWFLSAIYTSRWIPGLVDKLEELVANNPGFRYWLDGQTLIIEDLLALDPTYRERVQRLINCGCLHIGPYYCQPDWHLCGGELLLRNLLMGQQDVHQFGGRPGVGWLVDTFGHISQAPQIHHLCGIDAVYVWRGVPQLAPYFQWQGTDGSILMTINLFGGYRNLYGVTHAPEMAVPRLEAEVEKLLPYYPTPAMPLFDGYDLEDDPEDPVSFYLDRPDMDPALNIQEATPNSFAREIINQQLSLPVITGELNSGKYGATFPGTLSARTYLKLMAHDCERLLFRMCEPLGALAALRGRPFAAGKIESWTRKLLQNAVHDCLCGVSIDQVHERMEDSYRQIHAEITADINQSLAVILHGFASGVYALSTNSTPAPDENWIPAGDNLYHVHASGVGIWPVNKQVPLPNLLEPVTSFQWQNRHYNAIVTPSGVVQIGSAHLGKFLVCAETGDTYSDVLGQILGSLQPVEPLTLVQQSDHYARLQLHLAWRGIDASVTANIQIHFDQSPLVRWNIDLDSRGTDLRVEMTMDTGIAGNIAAGMPFDSVSRPVADRDLLPLDLPSPLSKVLLGQRELNSVFSFPFHDYVLVQDEKQVGAVFARGLRSYRADESGGITLTLRRAVEWLTRSDLPDRVGDAGPFFYVPDARCERSVHHEVAFAPGLKADDQKRLQQLNDHYQNPPILVQYGGPGDRREWTFWQEALPMSAMYLNNESVLARVYNPTPVVQPLSRSYPTIDVWGQPQENTSTIAPHQILTVQVDKKGVPQVDREDLPTGSVTVLTPFFWRVGQNHSRPNPAVLAKLTEKIAQLEKELEIVVAELAAATGDEHLRIQHRYYVLKREAAEYELSLLLNHRKLVEPVPPSYAYLYAPDPEIAALGLSLNRLRIKRRIFDYIIAALSP